MGSSPGRRARAHAGLPLLFSAGSGFCAGDGRILGCHAASGRRLYVLVQVEHVGWVVLVLESEQTLELAIPPEEVLDLILALIIGKVQGDAGSDERFHRCHGLARPANIGVVIRRVLPHREQVECVGSVPTADGGLALSYPAYRPPLGFYDDHAERRAHPGRLVYQGVYGLVAELVHVLSLPVVAPPRWVGGIY